jgi:hypothetical protein
MMSHRGGPIHGAPSVAPFRAVAFGGFLPGGPYHTVFTCTSPQWFPSREHHPGIPLHGFPSNRHPGFPILGVPSRGSLQRRSCSVGFLRRSHPGDPSLVLLRGPATGCPFHVFPSRGSPSLGNLEWLPAKGSLALSFYGVSSWRSIQGSPEGGCLQGPIHMVPFRFSQPGVPLTGSDPLKGVPSRGWPTGGSLQGVSPTGLKHGPTPGVPTVGSPPGDPRYGIHSRGFPSRSTLHGSPKDLPFWRDTPGVSLPVDLPAFPKMSSPKGVESGNTITGNTRGSTPGVQSICPALRVPNMGSLNVLLSSGSSRWSLPDVPLQRVPSRVSPIGGSLHWSRTESPFQRYPNRASPPGGPLQGVPSRLSPPVCPNTGASHPSVPTRAFTPGRPHQ